MSSLEFSAAGEGFSCVGPQFDVFEAYWVIGHGTQLAQVDPAVGEDALVGRDVHDASDHVAALGIVADEFALECHGQLVDHRGVDMRRACGMESRLGELVGLVVSRDYAQIVACGGLCGCRHADGECPCGEDVFRGLVPFGEAYADHLVGEYAAPRRIHGVGPALLVVCRHDQYRHGIEPALRSKVFFHNGRRIKVCKFSIKIREIAETSKRAALFYLHIHRPANPPVRRRCLSALPDGVALRPDGGTAWRRGPLPQYAYLFCGAGLELGEYFEGAAAACRVVQDEEALVGDRSYEEIAGEGRPFAGAGGAAGGEYQDAVFGESPSTCGG